MFLLLALCMVIYTICGLVTHTPENVNESTSSNNIDPGVKQEVKSVENWSDLGDREVWIAARKMLEDLSFEATRERAPQGAEDPSGKPQRFTQSPLVSASGGEQGLILEIPQADLLLKERAYFVDSGSVYCYDKNRIIFRIGKRQRYYEVTTVVPNPPELDAAFDINGVTHRFDQCGRLWHINRGRWLLVTISHDPDVGPSN